MIKWPKIRIADEFNLQMGKTPARDNPSYWGGDLNWASIADIARSGMYLSKTKETISQLAVDESSIKAVPPDTIVMSFKLSIGRTAITTDKMYTNEAIMAFLPYDSNSFDLHFLYHLFSNRDWSEGCNKAVKGVTLNKATLNAARIPKPDISEQRTIALTLDKLRGLVEKCDEQIERLNQLVKSRFVEMFGDTFSNPKKWPSKTFQEAGNRLSDGPFGSNLKSSHYSDSGVRVIRLGNIGVGKFIDDDRAFIPYDHYEKLKKYTCRAGEIVIGTLGDPNLRACLVPPSIEIAVNKSDCVHYLPRRDLLDEQYVCWFLNAPGTLRLAASMIHGQTRSRVSSGQIAKMPIRIPPLALQREFAAFVAKVDKLAFAARRRRDLAQQMYRAKIQEFFG